MNRLKRFRSGTYRVVAGNVLARLGALVSVSLATFLIARQGGPAAVGVYALLRILPSLLGVTISAGLPGATAYFLAGPDRDNRKLPWTIVAIALAGGITGALLWAGASVFLQQHLFQDLTEPLVLLASLCVITRVLVATAKSCSQGTNDLPGSNRVIVLEEFMVLPVYGALWLAGGRGMGMLVLALLLADVLTSTLSWGRLVRRRFFHQAERPSRPLARRIAAYGMRAQVGGFVLLLNLRLDFILISVLAGPAVLGVYAIASKYAELVKLVSLALTYVLYPAFAAETAVKALQRARHMLPKAGVATAAVVVPLWIAAPFVIPAIYGPKFEPAVTPAHIILFGLVFDGVAGVITALLYGLGRPGLNSIALGLGLVVTVALDILLIPSFEATGGAIASACAYATTTAALAWFYWRIRRADRVSAFERPGLSGAS